MTKSGPSSHIYDKERIVELFLLQKANSHVKFMTKRKHTNGLCDKKQIFLNQFCYKKKIFSSNICQKTNFQISPSTKNGFIKSTLCPKNKSCDKKQIFRSNLRQKENFDITSMTKSSFFKSI